MEAMVNLIIVDLPTAKKSLKKIEIFRKSLLTLNTFSKEEIIKLEEAALGESGIMYKYQEGEKNYLLKPAVDKQKLASQPFRAEIQAAASKLQEFLSPETAVKVESFGGNIKLSKQELVDFSKENAKVDGLLYNLPFVIRKILYCPNCGERLMRLMPDGLYLSCNKCNKCYNYDNGNVGTEIESPYNNEDAIY